MGVVPSCYPSKSQRRVNAVTQPFDTRRLLSELITVQTAIVLNEDATTEPVVLPPGVVSEDDVGKMTPDSAQMTPQPTPQRSVRRCSVEYTITSKTSLGFPGDPNTTTTTTTTTSKAEVSTLNTMPNSTSDIVGPHVPAHNRDVQRMSDEEKKMPSIQELRETSAW